MIDHLYTIGRIITAMKSRCHSFDGVQMCSNESHTLKMIAEHEGISQAELSQWMFRTKGATSVVVDRLVEKGLVTRTREAGNQRRYLLALTDKGQRVHAAHMAFDLEHAAELNEALQFSGEEIHDFNRNLERVMEYYTRNYLQFDPAKQGR